MKLLPQPVLFMNMQDSTCAMSAPCKNNHLILYKVPTTCMPGNSQLYLRLRQGDWNLEELHMRIMAPMSSLHYTQL